DECRDTDPVEPLGRLATLVIHGQVSVATAGTDDDCSPRRLVRRGEVHGKRRFIHVVVTRRTWSTMWPKQLHFLIDPQPAQRIGKDCPAVFAVVAAVAVNELIIVAHECES